MMNRIACKNEQEAEDRAYKKNPSSNEVFSFYPSRPKKLF